MNPVALIYDCWADLLTYPDEDYAARLDASRGALAQDFAEAAQFLSCFRDRVQSWTTEQLQESYTQTFDLNPLCSLEVGWHLYGENYSRGEFLAEMRGQLRRLHVPESTELPDHLTHVLKALGRMPDTEANRFAAQFVQPALEKMLAGLAGRDCAFEFALRAIRAVVQCVSPLPPAEATEHLQAIDAGGRGVGGEGGPGPSPSAEYAFAQTPSLPAEGEGRLISPGRLTLPMVGESAVDSVELESPTYEAVHHA